MAKIYYIYESNLEHQECIYTTYIIYVIIYVINIYIQIYIFYINNYFQKKFNCLIYLLNFASYYKYNKYNNNF